MAGNYPDVPGHRFVLDDDGTQMYRILSSVVTQLSGATIEGISRDVAFRNTETDTLSTTGSYTMYYFPEPRTITGIFVNFKTQVGTLVISAIEYSTNTTNGTDGDWATLVAAPVIYPYVETSVKYRDAILSVSSTPNVRAIRIGVTMSSGSGDVHHNCHIFGEIPASSNPNRLAVWNPSTDVPIGGAYLDWGDSPRSSSDDVTFRVKNLSSTLTASDITLSCDAITDGSPSVAGMHLLSLDGSTFTATVNIASLAPGAISSVVTMRRVLPSNAPLGKWALRTHAAAASWA